MLHFLFYQIFWRYFQRAHRCKDHPSERGLLNKGKTHKHICPRLWAQTSCCAGFDDNQHCWAGERVIWQQWEKLLSTYPVPTQTHTETHTPCTHRVITLSGSHTLTLHHYLTARANQPIALWSCSQVTWSGNSSTPMKLHTTLLW